MLEIGSVYKWNSQPQDFIVVPYQINDTKYMMKIDSIITVLNCYKWPSDSNEWIFKILIEGKIISLCGYGLHLERFKKIC